MGFRRSASRNFAGIDRKSTRLNSSHLVISYAVFCLKKKKKKHTSACAPGEPLGGARNSPTQRAWPRGVAPGLAVTVTLSAGVVLLFFFFFFNDTATTEIYTLSLHDALPI